jgi:hypothetical protein
MLSRPEEPLPPVRDDIERCCNPKSSIKEKAAPERIKADFHCSSMNMYFGFALKFYHHLLLIRNPYERRDYDEQSNFQLCC